MFHSSRRRVRTSLAFRPSDLGLGEIGEKILRIGLKGYSAQPRNAAYVTLALSTMVEAA
jgi:hypothetical protein